MHTHRFFFTASVILRMRKLYNLLPGHTQFVLRGNSLYLVNELRTMNIFAFCFLLWQWGQKDIWVRRRVLPSHILLNRHLNTAVIGSQKLCRSTLNITKTITRYSVHTPDMTKTWNRMIGLLWALSQFTPDNWNIYLIVIHLLISIWLLIHLLW